MHDPDDRRLDGNALAGELETLFGVDVTTAIRTCAGCAHAGPLGEHPLYRDGPGAVLRCPACGAVGLRVVRAPDRVWIEMRGTASLEIAR